jgi:hypothetical protein
MDDWSKHLNGEMKARPFHAGGSKRLPKVTHDKFAPLTWTVLNHGSRIGSILGKTAETNVQKAGQMGMLFIISIVPSWL